MEFRKGIAVSGGVVIAPAMILDTEEYRIPRRVIRPAEVPHEREILEKSIQACKLEIAQVRDAALEKMGKQAANIFDFHIHVLQDAKLLRRFQDTIESKHYAAAYAVSAVMTRYEKNFAEMQDAFFAERVKDVQDIKRRLLRHVLGEEREDLAHLTQRVIVVAHDLTPGQVAHLDHPNVVGFVIDAGGRTGHAAIIARSMGLPGLVGLTDASAIVTGGDMLVLDGHSGLLIVNPDQETLDKYREQERKLAGVSVVLANQATLPATTTDGVTVNVLANIEFPHEVPIARRKGAEGVGLYRTEYAYLGVELPTEEELYQAYVQATRACEGKPVVIRTMDLGGDRIPHSGWAAETNPFLGCRSIRYCLQNLGLFKTQLRSILRASVEGDVRIMFPLITSLMEVRQAKSVVGHVMEDLEEDGLAFNKKLKIGIMIETPAAAICGRTMAAEVDFFSIGTNDLVQYTLAVDRGNERVANLFTPSHPAVLSLVRDIIKVGKQTRLDVSVCGEMAGDPEYALLLLGMGLQTFSMSTGAIPEVKEMIRSVSFEQAQRVARKILTLESEREVSLYLREEYRKLMPDPI